MSDLNSKMDRMLADGKITQGEAETIDNFTRFLKQMAGIPTKASERNAAEQRAFLHAFAELEPGQYQRELGVDPRWAGVRGRIGPTEDGVRMVELVVRWQDDTIGIRYMHHEVEQEYRPTIKYALDRMVRDLDSRIPDLPAGE